jgi:hypothetical protein
MSSIVEYRDDIPHYDDYPQRIVSPTRSSKCCVLHMVKVGVEINEDRTSGMYNKTSNVTTYWYKVCSECGFTVKCIVRDVLSEKEIKGIQRTFGMETFSRGWE